MKSTKITAQGMGRDSFFEEIVSLHQTSRNHKTKIMY